MKDKKTQKGKLFGPESGTGKAFDPPRFLRTKDKFGMVWSCIPSKFSNTNQLEVWAERKPEDRFVLRQENNGQVDLITLDLGQAYDVIRALTEALGTNN
jgi:hypothetical protein